MSSALNYTGDLELLAALNWSVQIPPLTLIHDDDTEAYALRALLKVGRRMKWMHNLRLATLSNFDLFALDTLTEVPIPSLTRLRTRHPSSA